MKLDGIKDKIKVAREAVEGEEEPYKTAAFQVILRKLLDSDHLEQIHSKTQEHKTSSSGNLIQQNVDLENGFEELAKICEVTVKELHDVLSVKNNMIQVIYPLKGKESVKQIVASQCILVAYEILFGKDSMDSSMLIKCVDYSGIGALNHFAENLKERTDLFRAAGKGRILDYRLTGPGRKSAYETIKKLSKGEQIT